MTSGWVRFGFDQKVRVRVRVWCILLRNHLQAYHKKEVADMVKEEEEEKKFKVLHGVKNEVFPTVA